MTQKIKMVATLIHPHHAAGEIYEVNPVQAASDVYLKRAFFADQDHDQPQRRNRNTYRRRDMRAE